MSTVEIQNTVGELVARRPGWSRVFERAGIDYCCGGKKTLEAACREKGLDVATIVAQLEQSAAENRDVGLVDAAAMSLTQLADHIERTHHDYLRGEIPRLDQLTNKVSSVHGEKDARLHEIRRTFLAFAQELASHMMKEERILFPMIRELEAADGPLDFHCGSIANPIRQMGLEHYHAGSALETMRELSDDYTPPEGACNTYRAMLDALAHLERDMHQHVHKEENVLFPRAIELEAQRAADLRKRA
jgi:regulator of cell morphogenesis and NO signaling